MYTLGRAFFQSAYVIVDYDQGNFSVSQTIFPNSSNPSHVVAIRPPGAASTDVSSSSSSSSSSHGLAAGAIAGIVVGVVLLLALGAALASWFLRRRAQKKKSDITSDKDSEYRKPELESGGPVKYEASGESAEKADIVELHDMKKDADVELQGTSGSYKAEMHDPSGLVAELEGQNHHASELDDSRSPLSEMPGHENSNRHELSVSSPTSASISPLSPSSLGSRSPVDGHGRLSAYQELPTPPAVIMR